MELGVAIRILVASQIYPAAIEGLKKRYPVVVGTDMTHDSLLEALGEAEVLVFRSGVDLTAEVLARASKLRMIVRAGSGMDNIDLDVVRSRNIRFERVPEPGARSVAELSFAMMLALARNLFEADRSWRQGHWVKHSLKGFYLYKKVLGILGAGSIGTEVGRLGHCWGMEVIGCVDDLTPAVEAGLRRNNIRPATLHEVVSQADFLTIHVPLTDETRGMIGEKELRSMKRGSYLLNLARGGVVDEKALLNVLKEGHLAGAGLDVHEAEGEGKISPLAEVPNVILTPHIGAQTVDSQREIGRRVVELIEGFAGTNGTAAKAKSGVS